MNRRRFLELLGMATVGATVAYSFPDIIVPKNIAIPTLNANLNWVTEYKSANPLTYAKLLEAYHKCRVGNYEPKWIRVNENTFRHIQSMIEPQYRFIESNPKTGQKEMFFMGAKIESHSPESLFAQKDGEVSMIGEVYGTFGRYKFDID